MLDELLAVRRATDPRFAGSRNDAPDRGGPKWVGTAARSTVAALVAVGAVLALALLGRGVPGALEWVGLATGILALALWATRPDDATEGDVGRAAPGAARVD